CCSMREAQQRVLIYLHKRAAPSTCGHTQPRDSRSLVLQLRLPPSGDCVFLDQENRRLTSGRFTKIPCDFYGWVFCSVCLSFSLRKRTRNHPAKSGRKDSERFCLNRA